MNVTTQQSDYATMLRRLSFAESDYNACLADWQQMIADGWRFLTPTIQIAYKT